MIDITTVTQVNTAWIFHGGERTKSNAENMREIWEQAKAKRIMYRDIIDELKPVHDEIVQKMNYHRKAEKIHAERFNAVPHDVRDAWDRDKNKSLADEYLHELDGFEKAVNFIHDLSERYYKIEIQALNAIHEKGW